MNDHVRDNYSIRHRRFTCAPSLRLVLWFIALLPLLIGTPLSANTLTVSSAADSGTGSLRDAIANASSGDSIVMPLLAGTTINLTSGPLIFTKNLSVFGPSSPPVVISGGWSVGVIVVNAGISVTLSGLSIEYGGSGLGGCIFNTGTLNLVNSLVTNCLNPNELGGGILNAGTAAVLNLSGTTVTGNVAGACLSQTVLGAGGGIFNDQGTVNIDRSSISTNFTAGGPFASGGCIFDGGGGSLGYGGGGGGIFNFIGTVTLTNSTVASNSTSLGGAIANFAGGTVTAINSTFASNSAGAEGGAFSNDSGSIINMVNSTVWNNVAYNQILTPIDITIPQTSGGGGGCGDSCIFTIVPNLGGGGINNGGTLNLRNSVLAQNTDVEPESLQTIFDNVSGYGTVNRSGSNLEATTTSSAGLDTALKNNGGPTQTLALLAASPAINAIALSNCTDLNGNRVSTDQRGVPRPQGASCDIGAYEYFASLYPLPTVAVYAIYDMVQVMPVSSSVKQDLSNPLLAAVASLNQGSIKTAKNQLSAFINQVNSLVRDSLLTTSQGSTLTIPAQAIIRSLGT